MAKKKFSKKVAATTVSSKKSKTLSSKALKSKASTRGSKASVKTAARPSAKPKAPTGASFPIICSECYGEYDLYLGQDRENISCPVCGHGCKMPQNDFFTQYSMYRSSQKKFATLGVLFIAGFAGLFILWVWMLMNPGLAMQYSLVKEDMQFTNLHYIFGGAMFLSFVGIVFAIVRYEKSIWYAYF